MARSRGIRSDSSRVVWELNQEWRSLGGDVEPVSDWATRHPALAGHRDLDGVLSAIRSDPDGVLSALLVEARAGSATAARTVLQAMLGKIVLMWSADPAAEIDAYLLAMWECISSYPINRRPHHIAANLALDTRKRARRGRDNSASDNSASIVPWPPGASFADVVDRARAREVVDHADEVAVLTAGDVIRAALELELIDPAAGAMLGSVYADGLTSGQAAGRHHTSAAVVRQRCSRAVRVLAEHSQEIASYA
jgi:DNA-directed RNA polymerase specialized sigma24 family protein